MIDRGTEFDEKGSGVGKKGLLAIGLVGMIAILLTAALLMVSVSANTNTNKPTPTPTPTAKPTSTHKPIATPAPTLTPTPAPAPVYFDGRRYGAPGNMVEDPVYKGVYIGNLGGLVAFIDIETYLAHGGVCRTGGMNGIPVYTRFGLDSQSMYDPNTGIVWSLIEDPWVMELHYEAIGRLGYTNL